jgi:hypothetical protein
MQLFFILSYKNLLFWIKCCWNRVCHDDELDDTQHYIISIHFIFFFLFVRCVVSFIAFMKWINDMFTIKREIFCCCFVVTIERHSNKTRTHFIWWWESFFYPSITLSISFMCQVFISFLNVVMAYDYYIVPSFLCYNKKGLRHRNDDITSSLKWVNHTETL